MKEEDIPKREKEKGVGNRSFVIIFTSLFLCLFFVGLTAVFSLRKNANAISYFAPYSESENSGFLCDHAEAQKLFPFLNGVLKISPDRISFLSAVGSEIYSVPIQMENPKGVFSQNFALIYDEGGFSSILFDKNGKLFQAQLDGAITYAAVSNTGISALIIERLDTKGTVKVFDKEGVDSASWESRDSGFPVAAAFSTDSAVLSISLVGTDASVVQSSLRQFSLKESKDTLAVENLGVYTLPASRIFPLLAPFSGTDIFLSGASSLVSIRDASQNSVDFPCPQVYSVFSTPSGMALLFSEGIGQEIRYTHIDFSLKNGSSFVLGNQLVAADSYSSFLLLAMDDKLLKIDAVSGELLYERTMEASVIRVGFVNANTVIVVTETGVSEFML